MKLLLLGVCSLLVACATATKTPVPVADQFAEDSDSSHYGEPGIYFAENPGETKSALPNVRWYFLIIYYKNLIQATATGLLRVLLPLQ